MEKGPQGYLASRLPYHDLAARVGFAAARRQAGEFFALLHGQLARHSGHSIGDIEDASRTGDPRRRRNLELTYLAFPVVTADGRHHDDAVKEEFRVALLRAGQQWDQVQAARGHAPARRPAGGVPRAARRAPGRRRLPAA